MKYSSKYKARHGAEFSKVIREASNEVKSRPLKDYIFRIYIEKFILAIRAANMLDKTLFRRNPGRFLEKANVIMQAATLESKPAIEKRFKKALEDAWSQVFDLGSRHTVEDLLYQIPELRSALDRTKVGAARFTGFDVSSFSDAIAEFASKEEDSPKDKSNVTRAENRYVRLRANIFNLKKSGVLYDYYDLEQESEKAARYSVEERKRFLQVMLEAGNTSRKAEVAKTAYLGKLYADQRVAALTDDYSRSYDSKVRKLMGKYLEKNIETTKQITDQNQQMETLVNKIASQVKNSEEKEGISPEDKAARILRTELALAYNFGKLSAFTSPEDRTRRFRWNADWELAGMVKDYEVCDFCREMDGQIFTADTLLRNGIRADSSILRYNGKNRTTFKDKANPVIPGHPNCVVGTTKVSIGYNNYIDIKDIKVGDYINVPTEANRRKVIQTHKTWHSGEIYRLRTASGRELVITGNHPVWTQRGWVEVQLLEPGTDVVYMEDLARRQLPSLYKFSKEAGKCHEGELSVPSFESDYNECFEGPGNLQSPWRCAASEESEFRDENLQQYSDDSAKSNEQSRNFAENDRYSSATSQTRRSLQDNDREGKVQDRLQRGPSDIHEKLLGSEHGSNTELLQDTLDIRGMLASIQPEILSTGLLLADSGDFHRGERLLDRKGFGEIHSISSRLPSISEHFDRNQPIPEAEENILPFTRTGIDSLVAEPYEGYVYNLSVEADEVYVAEGLVVHNCACFYTVMPKTKEEVLKEQGLKADKGQTVQVAVAATLLVGGFFLLARSNAFANFFASTVSVVDNPVADVTGAYEAAKASGADAAFRDILSEILAKGVK